MIKEVIKIIHYVWLGGEKSKLAKYCIRTWKRNLPDWKIIEWNENNFDTKKYPFVLEAIEKKKYAFAADFIRLKVLEQYGGVYMDTDVEVIHDFSRFLHASFVSSIQILRKVSWNSLQNDVTVDGILKKTGAHVTFIGLQAGFMYSMPQHPFLRRVITNIYHDGQMHFDSKDTPFSDMVIDYLLMNYLQKEYHMKYRDEVQRLADDILIYDSGVFSVNRTYSFCTCTIHWYEQSWCAKGETKVQKFKRFLKSNFPVFFIKLARAKFLWR